MRSKAFGLSILPLLGASCAMPSAEGDEGEAGTLTVALQEASRPGFVTAVKPYVVSVSPEYSFQALLSVGDHIPRTSNPSEKFRFVGIPDGIGTYRLANDETVVFVSHEFGNTTTSEPLPGEPLTRGAFVSKLTLDVDGRLVSGDRAYSSVWDENTLNGPAANLDNTTPGFARFCSGSLAYRESGFDRPVYFTGEESSGSVTYSGKGGSAVAIFEGELHTLPKMGRLSFENVLVQPKKGTKTVLIGMEDGPATPDNQLVMYVGTKVRKNGASPLRRNGLDNGSLHVFVSNTPGVNTEVEFTSGAIEGHWEAIDQAESLTDVQLEAAQDALGAFGFIRIEDGAFDPKDPNVYYFVTTGGGSGNGLGRTYKMTLDDEPTGLTVIEMLTNADELAKAGVDTAISPDNIGVSDEAFMMVAEDGTSESRLRMEVLGREGSIWRFDLLNGHSSTRVAELNPPGRDSVDVPTSGTWEASGIVPIKGFEKDTWLVNVQAHSPTRAPAPNTVEDGQLLMMRRTRVDALLSE